MDIGEASHKSPNEENLPRRMRMAKNDIELAQLQHNKVKEKWVQTKGSRNPNAPVPRLIPLEQLLEDDSDGEDGGVGEEEVEERLICDGCNKNCFSESFFVEETEEDFCENCYKNGPYYFKEKGEHRVKGQYAPIPSDMQLVRDVIADMVHELENWDSHPDLFESARMGSLGSLKWHIERQHEDVNMKDWGENTALHIACMLRHVDAIKYLLDHGADPSIKDDLARRPLELIKDKSLKRNLERFAWECTPEGRVWKAKTTVPPEASFESSHIWSAAFKGEVHKVKRFLEKDPNLCNAQDNRGNTPVIMAAMSESNEALKVLFSAGGNLNIKNVDNLNAVAFTKGPTKRTRLLKLQQQVDPLIKINALSAIFSPLFKVLVTSQASTVGKVEEHARVKLVKLGRIKRTFKKMRIIRELSLAHQAWEEEKARIRADIGFDRSFAVSEYALEVGTANTVNRILREEEELRQYLERLRLEDEERERQRQAELARLASIAAQLKRKAEEEEARRLALEEEERLMFLRAKEESLARQRMLAAQRAAEEAARLAEEERLKAITRERARIKAEKIAKDKADRPIKIVLGKRMFQNCGKI